MYQIREGSSFLFSVNLTTMSLEWTFRPLETTKLNIDDRFYLHCDLDLVWLSDSKQSVLLSTNSGTPIGCITYPKYERTVSEICWEDEDTSPYSQTGNSVWEIGSKSIGRVDSSQNKQPFIIIIHDIERSNPVAADIIRL